MITMMIVVVTLFFINLTMLSFYPVLNPSSPVFGDEIDVHRCETRLLENWRPLPYKSTRFVVTMDIM